MESSSYSVLGTTELNMNMDSSHNFIRLVVDESLALKSPGVLLDGSKRQTHENHICFEIPTNATKVQDVMHSIRVMLRPLTGFGIYLDDFLLLPSTSVKILENKTVKIVRNDCVYLPPSPLQAVAPIRLANECTTDDALIQGPILDAHEDSKDEENQVQSNNQGPDSIAPVAQDVEMISGEGEELSALCSNSNIRSGSSGSGCGYDGSCSRSSYSSNTIDFTWVMALPTLTSTPIPRDCDENNISDTLTANELVFRDELNEDDNDQECDTESKSVDLDATIREVETKNGTSAWYDNGSTSLEERNEDMGVAMDVPLVSTPQFSSIASTSASKPQSEVSHQACKSLVAERACKRKLTWTSQELSLLKSSSDSDLYTTIEDSVLEEDEESSMED